MLRKLVVAIFILVGFAFNFDAANGLGLGNVVVKSSLNEPLEAEIELTQLKDFSPNEIFPNLATREDFKRVGIERPFFLSGLKFETMVKKANEPYILITSRKPITEPYVNFLLEVHWPSGRLLREYTLLLDPEKFNAQLSPSLTSEQMKQEFSNQINPKIDQSSSNRYSPGLNKNEEIFSEKTVIKNDTLWEIAGLVRPSRDVSINQVMLAIYRENPKAFIHGDINLLKKGSVLRIPVISKMRNINDNEALQYVSQHESGTKVHIKADERGLTTLEDVRSRKDRLTIVGAGNSEEGVDGLGTSEDGDSGDGSLELLKAKEQFTLVSRENTELKDRMADLEDQIKALQKIIALKNNEMAALKEGLSNLPAADGNDQILSEEELTQSSNELNEKKVRHYNDESHLWWYITVLFVSIGIWMSGYLFKRNREKRLGEENEEIMSDLSPFDQSSDPLIIGPVRADNDESEPSDFSHENSYFDDDELDIQVHDVYEESDEPIAVEEKVSEFTDEFHNTEPDVPESELFNDNESSEFVEQGVLSEDTLEQEVSTEDASSDEILEPELPESSSVEADENVLEFEFDGLTSSSSVIDDKSADTNLTIDEQNEQEEVIDFVPDHHDESERQELDENIKVRDAQEVSVEENSVTTFEDGSVTWEDHDDDLSSLEDLSEISTKLDLAQAYVEMGDVGNAQLLLEEIIKEGSSSQQSKAQELLGKLK